MRTRRTSVLAYEKIKAEGLLSQLRFEVYEILYKHGPLTAGEAWSMYFPNRQRSSVSARMSELEARGVVYQVEERPCSLTSHQAIAWDVNASLPVDPPKKDFMKCPRCNGHGKLEVVSENHRVTEVRPMVQRDLF